MSFCMDVFVPEEYVRARQRERATMAEKPDGMEKRKEMGISTKGMMADKAERGQERRRVVHLSDKLAEELVFSCLSA